METPLIPEQFSPEAVRKTWIESIQRAADHYNRESLTNYIVALENWKLNAPVRAALGLAKLQRPVPVVALKMKLDNDGNPLLVFGPDLVCEPEPEPGPATPPTPGVIDIGGELPTLPGWRAVGPRDTVDVGVLVSAGGKHYRKTAKHGFAGLVNTYYVEE